MPAQLPEEIQVSSKGQETLVSKNLLKIKGDLKTKMLQKTKSLLIKLIMLLCVVCCAVALAIGLSGCSDRTVESMEVSGNTLIIYYSDGSTEELDLSDLECDCVEHTDEHVIDWWELKEHSYDEANDTFTNGVYLVECTECDYSEIVRDTVMHTWGEDQDIPADCTHNAVVGGHQCEVCGYVEGGVEQPGTALGHDWQESHPIYNAGDVVCEDGGLYITLCSRCDDYQISEQIEVRGHSVSAWTISEDPTETSTGTMYGTCPVCNNTVTVVLPALTLENAATIDGEATGSATGFYDVTTEVDGGCAEDSYYTFAINIAEGDQFTVNSVKGGTATTTATSTVAFTEEYEGVVVEGGMHYFTDDNGNRVNILIEDLDASDPNYNILQYSQFQTFVNVKYSCSELVEGYVFFVCEACEGNVLINVYGYHTNADGELINSIDSEDVIHHEATCVTPEYWSVKCSDPDCFCKDNIVTNPEDIAANTVYNGETIIRVGAPVDEDAHDYEVTVDDSDLENITVSYKCKLCGDSGVIDDATVTTEVVTTPVGVGNDCEKIETIYHVTYVDPNSSETITKDITTSETTHHSVTIEGTKYEIVPDQVIYSDDPLASVVEFFVNVPTSCAEEGAEAMIVCDVCEHNVLIEYRVAHTYADGWVTAPTCEDDGVRHCTVCNKDILIEDSALGHNWVLDSWTATGEVDGNNNALYDLTIHCSRCGVTGGEITTQYTVEDAIIDNVQVAQECDTDGIVDFYKAATETEPAYDFNGVNIGKSYHLFSDGTHAGQSIAGTEIEGYESGVSYNLTEWSFTYEEFVNVPFDCSQSGYVYVVCQSCQQKVLINVTGAHNPESIETAEKATHTHPAVMHCTDCDTYYFANEVAGVHEWKVTSVTNPTDTTEGSITISCTGCDVSFTTTLPALADSDWTKAVISGGCETDSVIEYSIDVQYELENEPYTYTNGDTSITFTPAEETTTVNVPYSFRNEVEAIGHEQGDGLTYEWDYPEGEEAVTYVGYICENCNQMIVIWASDGSVGDPADKPEVDKVLGTLNIVAVTE